VNTVLEAEHCSLKWKGDRPSNPAGAAGRLAP